MMPSSSPSSVHPVAWLLGVALIIGACSGGNPYSFSAGELADRYLPTERSVDYHPDSLGSLSIEEEDERFSFVLDRDYEALHRIWSTTYQSMGTRRSGRPISYATFWSRELSLAALQPEFGINTLTPDRADELLRERNEEYQRSIQIDIYWFEREGNSLLTGPGSRVVLRVNDKRLRPSKSSHGPLREAFLQGGGRQALYRRNTFYFPRTTDSLDVLAEAEKMELMVNRSGTGSRIRFSWSWEPRSTTSHRNSQLPSSQALPTAKRPTTPPPARPGHRTPSPTAPTRPPHAPIAAPDPLRQLKPILFHKRRFAPCTLTSAISPFS